MDVTIVIINWNSKDFVAQCLKSIYENTANLRFEVMVADNGSFDGCDDLVRKRYPHLTFKQLGRNYGFAKANNLAARGARGRYLLFLNPDTELLTDAITGMARFLDGHTVYHGAGCRLEDSTGNIQLTCARTFPSPIRQLSRLIMLYRLLPKIKAISPVEQVYWDHRDDRDVDCLSGACFMIRRDVFERIGGFDERIFMYADDVDLCYRIWRDGGKIRYLAAQRILHYGAGSTPKKKRNHFGALMQRESNLYFLRKHFGRPNAIAFRWAVGVGSIARMIMSVVLLPMSKVMPRRLRSVQGAFDKYRVLALWSIGLCKARVPR
ncbi:MAG: glycosyltransferase [Chitinivibrionales bacterium]|nr:glycosyltransferase [Chitinivibrionales bacterium]MBD3358359.1 glycosyltransferase [Chitinivibrionales bacterium]